MCARAPVERQGDGRVRARHWTQPAGAQHCPRQGRQVCVPTLHLFFKLCLYYTFIFLNLFNLNIV